MLLTVCTVKFIFLFKEDCKTRNLRYKCKLYKDQKRKVLIGNEKIKQQKESVQRELKLLSDIGPQNFDFPSIWNKVKNVSIYGIQRII